MLRRLFTLLSAASLVLCVGMCVLWVRSYWVEDVLACRWWATAETDWRELSFHSDSGHCSVEYATMDLSGIDPVDRDHELNFRPVVGWLRYVTVAQTRYYWRDDGPRNPLERWGFYWGYREPGRTPCLYRTVVAAPHWVCAVALAVLPAIYTRRWHRRRTRSVQDCCPSCGYDLRATPDRCPECGTVPAGAKISG